jgi:hypothetical protein
MALTDAQVGGQILDHTIKGWVTLADNCLKGDLLGYSSGWKRALATVGSVVQSKCVALMDGLSGDKIAVCFDTVRLGGRLSGMTIGNPIYCAEGTAKGQYTETAPSTSGDVNKIVGYSIAVDEAIICPMSRPDTVA